MSDPTEYLAKAREAMRLAEEARSNLAAKVLSLEAQLQEAQAANTFPSVRRMADHYMARAEAAEQERDRLRAALEMVLGGCGKCQGDGRVLVFRGPETKECVCRKDARTALGRGE